MKKSLLFLVFLFLGGGLVAAVSEPIPIDNTQQLANMNKDGSYMLVADINLPEDWIPIDFNGDLDGRGRSISGGKTYVFKKLENAQIKNLVIEGFDVYDFVGLLAAEAVDCQFIEITIKNSSIRNSEKLLAVGGLAAVMHNCLVERVIIEADIQAAAEFVGGIAGIANSTRFYSSGVENGSLIGSHVVGGFVGKLAGTGLVLACNSNADVIGMLAGGFVGRVAGESLTNNANHKIEIMESTATGKVTAETAGGFAGEASFVSISECGVYGEVIGEKAGGFVAGLYDKSRVIYSYAKSNVHGGQVAGGFVGEIAKGACVEFGFSGGIVMGDAIVGGFVGVLTDDGEPNTITSSLSFAPWVIGLMEGKVHRFAGYAAHRGVNGCYALLSSMVVRGDELGHVFSNAYGADGGDMSAGQVEEIADRLGWRRDRLY